MSVTADDLLDWAFQVPNTTEADVRAIISRAYYAAYHRCSEWHGRLRYHGSCPSTHAGEHERLIQQLKNPNLGNPVAKRQLSSDLGKRLEDLKALRVLADYRISRSIAKGLDAQACADADAILALAV